jgi:hypothetical protein
MWMGMFPMIVMIALRILVEVAPDSGMKPPTIPR